MLQIRDIMTRQLFTVTPETTLREAADLFARHHISGAPVLAGHEVVGVVSASDFIEFVASHEGGRFGNDTDADDDERTHEEFDNEIPSLVFSDRAPEDNDDEAEPFHPDNGPPADLFSEYTVDEVMSRSVCSLAPDAKVDEAAEVMWQAGIHRLLVLDNGRLRGIVSMSDLARVLATSS
ncbi:MAG: CBS domain-containing protein [bacterium]